MPMSERFPGSEPPDTRSARDPEHPDSADSAGHHDEQGRAPGGPYVPPGYDERGNPQPSVPHEGLLGRIGVAVIGGQSVVLLVVAVAGYVVSAGEPFTSQADTTFLALRLNPAHSTLLLVTALLGAASLVRRTSMRAWAGLQAVVYLLVFVLGSAFSANLPSATPLNVNTPDSVLHVVLALLGFIILMLSSARVIEPPPGPPPYPEVLSDENGEREGDR